MKKKPSWSLPDALVFSGTWQSRHETPALAIVLRAYWSTISGDTRLWHAAHYRRCHRRQAPRRDPTLSAPRTEAALSYGILLSISNGLFRRLFDVGNGGFLPFRREIVAWVRSKNKKIRYSTPPGYDNYTSLSRRQSLVNDLLHLSSYA
jgi:hypothetical protein